MNDYLFVILSLIISAVPFSIALSSSVYRCIVWKETLRIAVVFALFQAGMFLAGWKIGSSIKDLLEEMAFPAAALIILFMGVRMILDWRKRNLKLRTIINENFRILIGFAFVTSINTALLSMGLGILFHEFLFMACLVFAIVFLMVVIGIQAGKRGIMNLGRTAELLGGACLVIFCVLIFLQYLKIL